MFRVSVSLADFYYWNDKFNIKSELEYLNIIKKLDVDDVELHFKENEILNEEYLKFKDKLYDLFVTVHLPQYTESKQFYKNILKMKKILNVNYFIIHADVFDKKKEIPKSLKLLIENSDKQKTNFKNTKELLKFKYNFCFDIDHSEENFIDSKKIKQQYNIIKQRTKEFHISTIENKIYNKYNYHTTHKLFAKSGKKIPAFLDKNTNFVIEGLIPKNSLDLLKKEIKLIKKTFS